MAVCIAAERTRSCHSESVWLINLPDISSSSCVLFFGRRRRPAFLPLIGLRRIRPRKIQFSSCRRSRQPCAPKKSALRLPELDRLAASEPRPSGNTSCRIRCARFFSHDQRPRHENRSRALTGAWNQLSATPQPFLLSDHSRHTPSRDCRLLR
jgi:hypothetical protein